MTPREVVYRAIERREPSRVPVHYCNRDLDCSDTRTTGYAQAASFQPVCSGMTEWGYVWRSLDQTMGQPEFHPLADDAAFDSYHPPDPDAPGRMDHIAEFVAGSPDHFRRFGLGISGFNLATFLRGFDNLLMDLYLDRPRAIRVIDMVFDFETAIIAKAVMYDIDCIVLGDDWGTQRELMISPDLWREIFRPLYARQFEIARAAGKKVWLHTCGNVWAIIPDLIEIGLDVIELLQPDLFGVEKLGKEFGGKTCFCCSVDHQRRALSGTREEIFTYAELLNEHLGRFQGGFIGYVEDYASLGMTEQNYQWIRQAFGGLKQTRKIS